MDKFAEIRKDLETKLNNFRSELVKVRNQAQTAELELGALITAYEQALMKFDTPGDVSNG